jgi:hypothetical protein
LDYP